MDVTSHPVPEGKTKILRYERRRAQAQAAREDDEDDYVDVIVRRLQQARWATREAAEALQQAQDAESAVWALEEDYLLEAARWHQKQTGSPRLEAASGTLTLQEIPEHVRVVQIEALAAWVRQHQLALEELARALESSFPSTAAPPQVLATPSSASSSSAEPPNLEAALLSFYCTTGLVPNGCRVEPACGVLTLE